VAPLKSADILFKKRRFTMRIVGKMEGVSVVGKRVYVGIDVYKESWQVTVRAEGEEIFNGRIPGQYQSLKRLLERYRAHG
jgi:hypothetical protein